MRRHIANIKHWPLFANPRLRIDLSGPPRPLRRPTSRTPWRGLASRNGRRALAPSPRRERAVCWRSTSPHVNRRRSVPAVRAKSALPTGLPQSGRRRASREVRTGGASSPSRRPRLSHRRQRGPGALLPSWRGHVACLGRSVFASWRHSSRHGTAAGDTRCDGGRALEPVGSDRSRPRVGRRQRAETATEQ